MWREIWGTVGEKRFQGFNVDSFDSTNVLTPQMFCNEPQASEAQQRTTQRTYASVIKPCAPQIDMVSIKSAAEDLS